MLKVTHIAACLAVISLSGTAMAAPDAKSVREVWDFFYGGGEGVVLADAKLCYEVGKEGEEKFECVDEVGVDGVEKGTTVSVWQAFMAPADMEEAELSIQAKHGSVVRQTKDFTIKGGWRYRTWKSFRLNKTGTWSFTVLHDGNELKTLTVSVH